MIEQRGDGALINRAAGRVSQGGAKRLAQGHCAGVQTNVLHPGSARVGDVQQVLRRVTRRRERALQERAHVVATDGRDGAMHALP